MQRTLALVVFAFHLAGCGSSSNHDTGPCRQSCAPEAACSDTPAGPACVCNPGYRGDGLTCSDIDECSASTAACAAHASCENAPGSFSCTCDGGYAGDGMSACAPSKFVKVAPAGGFTCALGGDGGIYCWGYNFFGNLGDGTTETRTRPVQVGTSTDWIDIDTRLYSACGIRADHSMWCWGHGSSGQLGNGRAVSEYAPVQVISDKPGIGWKAMALGRQQACGLHDDGSLACWGLDRVTGRIQNVPTAVDDQTDWTQIAVANVRCGIRGTPGHLYCWGESLSGELGLGEIRSQATPAQVGVDTWSAVAAGYQNTCGIRGDGALLCWGNSGQHYGSTPQQIGTATDWEAITLSASSIIGLRAGGRLYGWGLNDVGQLGIQGATDIVEPTPIGEATMRWSMARAGNVHSCGISGDQMYCWGEIGGGNLGNGTSTTRYSPARIGSDRWAAITGGRGLCGLRDDGALMCWGHDATTGIGFGTTDPVWTPTRLGMESWTAVTGGHSAAGGTAQCAIRDGLPYCWGDNSSGELGIGTIAAPQRTPVAVHVPPGTRWTKIAIADHACAIDSAARLWCWGANEFGQLGNGAASDEPMPAPSTSLPGTWLDVALTGASAASATCGIQTDHTLWCWGALRRDLGAPTPIPTKVDEDATWMTISAGGGSSGRTACAIRANGTLWCWGAWLGNGTRDSSLVPVQVGTSSDWSSISVGGEICAIKTGGTLWCWANDSMPLGDGKPQAFATSSLDAVPATSPTQIGTDTDWTTVITNGKSDGVACAIKRDGSLWCWGYVAAAEPDISVTPVRIP